MKFNFEDIPIQDQYRALNYALFDGLLDWQEYNAQVAVIESSAASAQ